MLVMSDISPLPYASSDIPEERILAGVCRAVAWMAIVYGIASVANSALNSVYLLQTAANGVLPFSSKVWISVNVPAALLKGLLAVAGWMMLARVLGGVKLLRIACWLLVIVPLILTVMADIAVQRAGVGNRVMGTLSNLLTAVTVAALPGLILMLPMRKAPGE